jgi:TolB-like protein
VLPFTNRSGLPEDEVFAIGMVEDVIDALSQGVKVRVLSSSATARFGTGALPDLAALGQQLGVRYLLEGNVRRVGNDLRVTTQLVEAAHGEILSTQKFDRPLAELAALQEDLVRSVATNLGTQVQQLEIERALCKPDDLTAWEYVTRSYAALRQLTTASMIRAREEASCALEIAPDYGWAHAWFAHLLGIIYWTKAQDNELERREISTHVDRALLLAPNSGNVLTSVGTALNYIGKPQDGLRHAQRALQRSPFYGLAHYATAQAYEALGQVDAALNHFREAIRFESGGALEYALWYRMGRAHLRGENWATADGAYAQSIALNDSSAFMPCEGALVARHLGRTDDAQTQMATSRRLDPAITLADWERRLNLWHAGSPVLDELLTHLRALWAETEGSKAP